MSAQEPGPLSGGMEDSMKGSAAYSYFRYMQTPRSTPLGAIPTHTSQEAYEKWARIYEDLISSQVDGKMRVPQPQRPDDKIAYVSVGDKQEIHRVVTQLLTTIDQLMGAVVEQDEQPNYELVVRASEEAKKLLKRLT